MGLYNWVHLRLTEQDFLIIHCFNHHVSVRETFTWFMSPTQGLLGLGASKNKVSEVREAHFMIQPPSVKGNDSWIFISILHNTIHWGQKSDIAWNQQPLHTQRLLFVRDDASSLLPSFLYFIIFHIIFFSTIAQESPLLTFQLRAFYKLSALHRKERGEIWSKWSHE